MGCSDPIPTAPLPPIASQAVGPGNPMGSRMLHRPGDEAEHQSYHRANVPEGTMLQELLWLTSSSSANMEEAAV